MNWIKWNGLEVNSEKKKTVQIAKTVQKEKKTIFNCEMYINGMDVVYSWLALLFYYFFFISFIHLFFVFYFLFYFTRIHSIIAMNFIYLSQCLCVSFFIICIPKNKSVNVSTFFFFFVHSFSHHISCTSSMLRKKLLFVENHLLKRFQSSFSLCHQQNCFFLFHFHLLFRNIYMFTIRI